LKIQSAGFQSPITNQQGFGAVMPLEKRFGYLEAGVARLKLGVVWR